MPANSVGTTQLKKSAVTTSKIKNGAVTGTKVANGTLTGAKIKLSTLGTVPSATNAANATTAARLGAISYHGAVFAVPGSASDSRATAHVNCGAGTFAVGGGTTSPDESVVLTDFLIDSHPTAGGAGWEVTVENETLGTLNGTVWAVCAPAASG